jgi:hypothetical protein
MRSLNARLAASLEKALQALVSKALDHFQSIVVCSASSYNAFANISFSMDVAMLGWVT